MQNKQEGIVLERSARLNLNPGRGDGGDGGDGEEGGGGGEREEEGEEILADLKTLLIGMTSSCIVTQKL